jgi:hypothetical protein
MLISHLINACSDMGVANLSKFSGLSRLENLIVQYQIYGEAACQ